MKKVVFLIICLFIFLTNTNALYEIDFELNSDKAIVVNTKDNIILYQKNADKRASIASLTKIVTALTVIENVDDLDKEVTVTYNMLLWLDGYAKAGFRSGDKVTIRELLYALMLPSGADAAQILSISVSGNIYKFVDLMNEEVKKIGVTNTHFSNPVGMDEDSNYSTAYDLYKILDYALKNKEFKEIYESQNYYIDALNKSVERTIVTTSKQYDIDVSMIKGAKTGYTEDAGMCLSSTATLDDIDYMVIVLNAKPKSLDHITDTNKLYSFYKTNYGYVSVVEQDDLFKKIVIKDSKEKEYEIRSKENVKRYLKKDLKKQDIKIEYDGVEEINNKFKTGDFLGTVKVLYEDEILYETKVYLDRDIKFYNYKLYNICIGITISLVLIIIIILIIKKKKKKK